MPTAFHLQSSFTSGELTELLHARADLEQYQKGAKRLRNVLIAPQGGAKRRFGTRLLNEIQGLGSSDEIRLTTLTIDGTNYIVSFTANVVDVFEDDGVNLVQRDQRLTPYGASDVKDLEFTQDEQQLIIVHPLYTPRFLTRDTPTAFPLVPFTFKQRPVYDFAQDYDAITFSVTGTTGNIEIDTNVNFWETRHEGGILSINEGNIRINTVDLPTPSTKAFGTVIDDLDNTDAQPGTNVFLGEVVFSDLRGHPQQTTFFQNRLVFGATNTLPSGVWTSRDNSFEDFDDFQTDDSAAVSNYLRGDHVNEIRGLLGIRSLVAFTSDGEFSTPLLEDTAFKPGTFFTEQSRYGMKANVDPIVLDNQLFYVDKGGKIVRNFVYDIQRGSYLSENISILSPQIIRDPVSLATYESPDLDDGTFLLIVNGDGTLAIFQSVINQQVQAWSLSTTDGLFKQVVNIDSNVYFLIERTIEGNTRYYIEKLDFDCFMDSCINKVFGSPEITITGLDTLAGKTVDVIADGFVQTQKTVTSGGEITLDEVAQSVSVGLPYTPEIVPMPLALNTQTGNDLYLPKSIKRVYVDFFESLGIYVNGKLLKGSDLPLVLDTPPVPQTNFDNVAVMTGWDPRAEVSITQQQPLPMFIRAIGYEVELQ